METPIMRQLLSILLLTLSFETTESAISMKPCDVPGTQEKAQCGIMEVLDDPGSQQSRKIPLKIMLLPATTENRADDPIFVFLGGPGDPATESATWIGHELKEIRKHRDIVLIDQRGSGGSNGLILPLYDPNNLQSYLGSFYPADAVKKGRLKLEKNIDLALYTTTNCVEDFDQVRAALGYQQINLIGFSYGTRVELVYLRLHPDKVRTAVLYGVTPTDDRIPLPYPKDAQRALDGVLGECLEDSKCKNTFPEIHNEAKAVFERLAKEPVRVEILHPSTGELTTVSLSRSVAAEAIRYLLYQSGASGQIPMILHQANHGDFQILAEMAIFSRQNIVDSGSNGLYLSVTCAEDLPWILPGEGEKAVGDSFLGDYRLVDQRAACKEWPRGKIPEDFLQPVRANNPVLIFSGQWDPVTPPSKGDAVAKYLPNSLHVVVPHAGHNFSGLQNVECLQQIRNRFVETGRTQELDTSCVRTIQRPAFTLTALPMRTIKMSALQMEEFVGQYATEDSKLQTKVELGKNSLRISFGKDNPEIAVPVDELRFRVAGPPGFYVQFEKKDKKVLKMILLDGPDSTILIRK